MVSSFSLAVLLASTLLVRADVVPNTPNTAKEGSQCVVSWEGDSNSTSNWSNMAIEFMTGDNFNMVFLTTVATGLDGTKDGTFSWTCPQVNPSSPIYFYQFISPTEASNQQWTTRFAISDASGNTTPAPNNTQSDGSNIPWGIGALVTPSSVSAAPSFAANATTGGSAVPTSSVSSNSTSTAASISATASAASKSGAANPVLGNTSGAAGHAANTDAAATSVASTTPGASTNSNSGLGLAVDGRVWTSAFGVVGSATALALFL